MNDESSKLRSLDLGLTALIDEPELAAVPTSSSSSDLEESKRSSSETQSQNVFIDHAREGNWAQLGQLAEGVTKGAGKEWYEARLWWVESQRRLDAMPLSILSAPFHSVAEELLANEELRRGLSQPAQNLFAELRRHFGHGKSYPNEPVVAVPKIAPLESAKTPTTATWPSPLRKDEPTGAGNRTPLAALLTLLLISGAAYYFYPQSLKSPSAFESTGTPLELQPQAKEPLTERKSGLGSFDAVLYSINGKGHAGPDNTSAEVSAESSSPATEVAADRPREIINTTGPIEPPNWLTESHDQTPQVVAGGGAVGEYRGDILFGDRRGDGWTVTSEKAKPKIPIYAEPQRYVIAIGTHVLDSPSFRAEEMGFLEAGSEVLVEERIGDFLRIRSKSGHPGFIMRQDANEVRN